jgi:O-Antigen ligase
MRRGAGRVCPRLSGLVAANPATTAPRATSGLLVPALLVLVCGFLAVATAISPAGGAILAAIAGIGAVTTLMMLGLRVPFLVWPGLAVPGALLTALYPITGVVIAAVIVIGVLAIRAPAYSFLGTLLLFGFEGTIKMRLTVEGMPSPLGVGAALIDLALLISVAGLLVDDRGRSLQRLWERFGRGERLVTMALGAWIVLAVLQIPLSTSISNGVEGVRLTHFYLIALPAGVVLAAKLPPARLEVALLAIATVVAGYAALRGIIGNSAEERHFAASRDLNTLFLEHARDTGSFTSPVALVSFLVPAGLFGFTLACLEARRRVLGAVVFGLAMVGIVASYVRTAFVAVVAGALAMAGMLLASKSVSRQLKWVSAGLVVVVLAGGYGAVQLAGNVNEFAKHRAESLSNPLSDYSVKQRFKTWKRSLEKTVHHPLGTGPGTVGRATIKHGRKATYTDSSYLKIIQEQGFPGGFVFLFGVLGAAALCLRRLVRAGPLSRPLGVAALVGFVTFLVLCVTGENIEQPGKAMVWAMLGIAAWEGYGR